MNEEEAKQALFQLNYEYMSHKPKERIKLYDEYKKNREIIRESLREKINEEKKLGPQK